MKHQNDFTLYSLYKQLMIPIPNTGLILLTNISEKNAENFYALQVLEAISGEDP